MCTCRKAKKIRTHETSLPWEVGIRGTDDPRNSLYHAEFGPFRSNHMGIGVLEIFRQHLALGARLMP